MGFPWFRLKMDVDPPVPWQDKRRIVPALVLVLLLAGFVGLAFIQGLNWDEPWILGQARALATRQPTEPFKPLAGLVALPLVGFEHPWVFARVLTLGWLGGLGWVLWRMFPVGQAWDWKVIGLFVLAVEPTFRERSVELRTEVPALVALGWAILLWCRIGGRSRLWAGLPLGLALGLAPKSALWVVSWGIWVLLFDSRKRDWIALLGVLAMAGTVALSAFLGMAAWTRQAPFGLLSAAAIQNQQALAQAGWFPLNTRYYLVQSMETGWPFLLLTMFGIVSGGWQRLSPAGRQWSASGMVPWLVLPFYSGGFPYHFVGLMASLAPLALVGLQALTVLWGRRALGAATGVTLMVTFKTCWPVLEGPWLSEQETLMVWVGSALKANPNHALGYVDGVGMLAKPQSAFFVTSLTACGPQAEALLPRWQRERASIFVLNGRTEQLFEGDRLAWAQGHLVRVHPNLAVLGTLVTGSKEIRHTWEVPWHATFRLQTTPGWTCQLNGRSLISGAEIVLGPGPLEIVGRGPGAGLVLVSLSHPSPPAVVLHPFFLPFQRNPFLMK